MKLSFQKCFLVLQVRFLRRGLFQVVSVTSRFESKPDLSASKHIKNHGFKVGLGIKSWLKCSCV
ncbi:hypothetical protein KUK78_004486 [Vibrio parahaemolyticus]|nr:hypothetical protein [Vibrio parahaemolyticus]